VALCGNSVAVNRVTTKKNGRRGINSVRCILARTCYFLIVKKCKNARGETCGVGFVSPTRMGRALRHWRHPGLCVLAGIGIIINFQRPVR